MVFAYGLIRVTASAFAFLAGLQAWPIWLLPLAIIVHAIGSHLFSGALFREVQERLARDGAEDSARSRHETFYQPIFMRELALAFVKCGVAYFAGFWLSAFFFAAPDAPAPEIPRSPQPTPG